MELNVDKLAELLLDQSWHKECVIDLTEKGIIVRYPNDYADTFLRYSKGPQQGFFWDVYGEDMHSYELAIIALSKAPIPLNYRKDEYPLKFNLKTGESK